MADDQYFKSKIFSIHSEDDFSALAMELFHRQARYNDVYRSYLSCLKIKPEDIRHIRDIPFLPIRFFKQFEVKTGDFDPDVIYTSSGTSGSELSRHFVKDKNIYRESFTKCFESFYGKARGYCILALLPSYLERQGSSLIDMAASFIEYSRSDQSGFYLNNLKGLARILKNNAEAEIPTILLGVSFALLDLAEQYPQILGNRNTIIMETGGMKGRRKEMVRMEMHEILKKAFGIDTIHSEYGMTELLSQAYSKGEGRFQTPPWMKVFVRDTDDPFTLAHPGKTGGINIIDLANVSSCAFIETEDLGRVYKDGSFEVMGRFDNSEIRGCNLMVI